MIANYKELNEKFEVFRKTCKKTVKRSKLLISISNAPGMLIRENTVIRNRIVQEGAALSTTVRRAGALVGPRLLGFKSKGLRKDCP